VLVRRTARGGGAILLVVALLSVGLAACSDDSPSNPDDSISHQDLVAAARAVGESCDPPNPQRVTTCGTTIIFVDGDRRLARRSYEGRCLESDDPYAVSGAWVWYDKGSWEFEAIPTITRESVRIISDTLGKARDCRRDRG
jgi:hypothetical protein